MGLKVEKQHKKVYWKDLLLLLENRITLGKSSGRKFNGRVLVYYIQREL